MAAQEMAGLVVAPGGHRGDYRKAAVVTGAGRRIGRAIALDLAAEGWALALHFHRSEEAATGLATEIERAGGRAIALSADLSNEADVESLIPRAQEALGPLGLLVNNASTFELDDALDATRQSWDRHLEPNLRAPFVLTQQFARGLPEKAEGLVVNLLDERVLALPGRHISYGLSKAGLWALTQSLAIALAPRVRVVGIGPGYCLPDSETSDQAFADAVAELPLGRSGPPDEVCAALRFFLACPSVTGQMIALDSGLHLVRRPQG